MRYLRADTLASERCPSCSESLLFLRWGHEERCERFQRTRRQGAMRLGAVLLVLTLALLATPAHAGDSVVPTVDDWNTKALATSCVVLLLAVGFLGRALLASYEKRLEEMGRAHAQTLETHSNVVKLGLQTTEAVAVLGEAVNHVTRSDS